MSSSFFSTRDLFWAFWANVLFILGMAGYVVMDGLDYMRPNALSSSLSAFIYVILAGVFVVNAIFQLIAIYHIHSSSHRYYAMLFSYIFDKLGSVSYLTGAILVAMAFTDGKIIWRFNLIGVCSFAVGAIIHMMVRGSSILYSWANILNLLGSLLYVLAFFITLSPLPAIIVILGDCVYLVDAILYKICWFSDRQLTAGSSEHIVLAPK